MDEKYEKSIHRIGRIGILIGLAFMLGIPAVICAVFDVWPESIGHVFAVAAGLLAVFIPTNIAEVFGYTPMLGSSAYITFLTGNVTNLKIPVVVNAQMPGNILDVRVKPGDSVKAGDTLVVLEAMKMENEISAPQDGTIASVNVAKGDTVGSGDLLCSLN